MESKGPVATTLLSQDCRSDISTGDRYSRLAEDSVRRCPSCTHSMLGRLVFSVSEKVRCARLPPGLDRDNDVYTVSFVHRHHSEAQWYQLHQFRVKTVVSTVSERLEP